MLCTNSIVQSGGGFITLLYVVVDTKAHRVSWTSAGHPPALLHRLDTDVVTQVGTNADGGLPLGIADGVSYDAFTFEGAGGKMFGVDGISRSLREARGKTLDQAMEHLFAASHQYTGGQGRHDDTSVLLLERDGQE